MRETPKKRGCGTAILTVVLLGAVGVVVLVALAVRYPEGPVRTSLDQWGLAGLLAELDAPTTSTPVPFRPNTLPQRPRPGAPLPPDPEVPTSAQTVLGVFPVFALTVDGLDGPIGSEQVWVAAALPPEWGHADGQFYDAQGQKVGEIGPGPFVYASKVTCATRAYSEMSGPPVEDYRFDFENARGVYRLTEAYCGGGEGTYAGACLVHGYCIEPGAGGLGLLVTFLELSPTPDPTNEARYDEVVDSIRLQPAE